MKWVMKIHGGDEPLWLEAFDLEYSEPDDPMFWRRGRADLTGAKHKAMRFDSFIDVMNFWKSQSKTCPLRPDGRANRPLTAYSIEPEQVDE